MDISLVLFSVAMFFQPVDLQAVDPQAQTSCEYLGVQYPVGQKLTIGKNGKIKHQKCLPVAANALANYVEQETFVLHSVSWVEVDS